MQARKWHALLRKKGKNLLKFPLHSPSPLCYNTPLMDPTKFTIAKPSIQNIGPVQFIRQAVEELKKVSWPTQSQTLKLTLVVIAVSVSVGLYIGALDFLFTKLIELFIR